MSTVDQKRAEVDALRAQIREQRAANAQAAVDGVDDFRGSALDREAEHLRDELESLRAKPASAPAPDLPTAVPNAGKLSKEDLAVAVAEQESDAEKGSK